MYGTFGFKEPGQFPQSLQIFLKVEFYYRYSCCNAMHNGYILSNKSVEHTLHVSIVYISVSIVVRLE